MATVFAFPTGMHMYYHFEIRSRSCKKNIIILSLKIFSLKLKPVLALISDANPSIYVFSERLVYME